MDTETGRSEQAGPREVLSTAPALSATGDGHLSAPAALTIQRVHATDVDEMSEVVPLWSCVYTQLHPGRFSGAGVIVHLGPMAIVHGEFNLSLLQQSVTPRGCVTLGRPARHSQPLVHHGREIEAGECFIAGPETMLESVNRGGHSPRTLSIRLDFWQAASAWLDGGAPPEKGEMALRVPGATWTTAFLDSMDWVINAVEENHGSAGRADVGGSIADSLLALVHTLGNANVVARSDRDTRACRRLAVERAREYIAQNLTDPIRLSELCRHARTQARSLEYGFREVLGLSPIAYVRTIRLQKARRLLRSTAVRSRSISEIALDCGFWHLSQFAVDYKILFGESPSVTLKGTMTRLPRTQRRRHDDLHGAAGNGTGAAPPPRRQRIDHALPAP